MAFGIGTNSNNGDAGIVRGIQKEVACECWCSSKGDVIPLMIKLMDEDGEMQVIRKRLIFLRRDNAIFFPHNSSQEMRASCSIARSKHLTILWRKDNASKSCHR